LPQPLLLIDKFEALPAMLWRFTITQWVSNRIIAF
jgi:hypothetical protein